MKNSQKFCIENSSADIVVVLTRGLTGMIAILFETVAEHIVRELPCSDLAVKPDGFKHDIDYVRRELKREEVSIEWPQCIESCQCKTLLRHKPID